jgi:hypothetical protein
MWTQSTRLYIEVEGVGHRYVVIGQTMRVTMPDPKCDEAAQNPNSLCVVTKRARITMTEWRRLFALTQAFTTLPKTSYASPDPQHSTSSRLYIYARHDQKKHQVLFAGTDDDIDDAPKQFRDLFNAVAAVATAHGINDP